MFPVQSKIMIIDDSKFARTTVRESLKKLHFTNVVEAVDARTAQQLLAEEAQVRDPVILMICDLHMPEVNGIELIRWVRTQERFKSLPVIVLTSVQEKGSILEAGKLGVSHYMIKPFDVATLKERMQSTWEKHGEKYFLAYGRRAVG